MSKKVFTYIRLHTQRDIRVILLQSFIVCVESYATQKSAITPYQPFIGPASGVTA